MKGVLRKLVLGDRDKRSLKPTGTIGRRIKNIKVIWNNYHHDDVGIEKIFRLFLATSQFLFPGIYIKHLLGKKGRDYQDLGMDFYLLLKVILPLSLVYAHWIPVPYSYLLVIWLLSETVLYVPTLIFASDVYAKPSSYRRSMLLLFFNYIEIVFAYSYIYSCGNYLNKPFTDWYDPVYFSFVTFSTIGFGEFHPVTGLGKFLVITQSIIFLSFVVLFINFYSRRIESPGYFKVEPGGNFDENEE